jgi:hypothetical protein
VREERWPEGRRLQEKGEGLSGFRFRFFFCFCFFSFKIAPSPCVSCGPIFIGKMLFGLQNWSLIFSFFVNFDSSCFFLYFLKTSNINVDLMRKINAFKNDA